VAIEAAHPDFWRKYVGRTGVVVGMPTFGESAPAKDLYVYFGITAERVVTAVRTLAHRNAHRREVPLPDQIVPSTN
jgi:transketolase